jgi:hypothetical protein
VNKVTQSEIKTASEIYQPAVVYHGYLKVASSPVCCDSIESKKQANFHNNFHIVILLSQKNNRIFTTIGTILIHIIGPEMRQIYVSNISASVPIKGSEGDCGK